MVLVVVEHVNVGRAGDNAVGETIGHRGEYVAGIADVECDISFAPVDRGDHLPLSVMARRAAPSLAGSGG